MGVSAVDKTCHRHGEARMGTSLTPWSLSQSTLRGTATLGSRGGPDEWHRGGMPPTLYIRLESVAERLLGTGETWRQLDSHPRRTCTPTRTPTSAVHHPQFRLPDCLTTSTMFNSRPTSIYRPVACQQSIIVRLSWVNNDTYCKGV